jgi:DNA transformation protein
MPLPHSPFVDSVLDLLLPFGGVSARRMFGAYGIYKDGLMFGLVDGERLYFKADDENRAAFEGVGMEPMRFTDKNGKVLSLSYYQAPEAALSNPMRMEPWARSGWEAALRKAVKTKAPAKKKAPRKKK